MIGLYFFGIFCGILYALLLKGRVYRGEPVPFVMELPNYRLPSAKSVVRLIWEKAKGFIQKAFTIILRRRSSSGPCRPSIRSSTWRPRRIRVCWP